MNRFLKNLFSVRNSLNRIGGIRGEYVRVADSAGNMFGDIQTGLKKISAPRSRLFRDDLRALSVELA